MSEANVFTCTKDVSEVYRFTFDRGWAVITINEKLGMFDAQSDWGSYSYAWPKHGRESFKHFLIQVAKDKHYFLGKVSAETYFDVVAHIKKWKKALIDERRQRSITKEQAREIYETIEFLIDHGNNCDAVQREFYGSDTVYKVFPEPWYTFSTDKEFPRMAVIFAEKVMGAFSDVLKEELGIK